RQPGPRAAVGAGAARRVHHRRDRAHGGPGAAGRGGGLLTQLLLLGDVRGRRGAVAHRAPCPSPTAVDRRSRVGARSAVLERLDRRRRDLRDRAGGGRKRVWLSRRARRAGARVPGARGSGPLQRPRLRALRAARGAPLPAWAAQAVCDVCAVGEAELGRLVTALMPTPWIVTLHAHTLDGVVADIGKVGEALELRDEAEELVAGLRYRLRRVRLANAARPTAPSVLVLEWLDPPYVAGHWVPELVALAGGRDVGHVQGARPGPRLVDAAEILARLIHG